jgi:hypothetical protein
MRPYVWPGGEVGVVAVLAELECVVEGVFDVGEDLVDDGEAGGGGRHAAGDPRLFVLEEVGGDGVAVVELEELAALVVELGEQGLLLSPLELGVGASGAEPGVDVLAQGGRAVGGEMSGSGFLEHGVLRSADVQVSDLA